MIKKLYTVDDDQDDDGRGKKKYFPPITKPGSIHTQPHDQALLLDRFDSYAVSICAYFLRW